MEGKQRSLVPHPRWRCPQAIAVYRSADDVSSSKVSRIRQSCRRPYVQYTCFEVVYRLYISSKQFRCYSMHFSALLTTSACPWQTELHAASHPRVMVMADLHVSARQIHVKAGAAILAMITFLSTISRSFLFFPPFQSACYRQVRCAY